MHFNIDSANKLSYIHLEKWDSQVLGEKLCKKINSYKGKHLNEFLKFVLKEKLFLKLRIFYLLMGPMMINFWAASTCHPKAAENIYQAIKYLGIKSSFYVNIYLKPENKKNALISILREDILASVHKKLGFSSKTIELEMTPRDIRDISIAFNIARNRLHQIRGSLRDIGKTEEEKKKFMIMELKGPKFIAIKKDLSLEIIDDVNKILKKNISEYNSIVHTFARNEKEKLEINQIVEKIKSKIKNSVVKNEKETLFF